MTEIAPLPATYRAPVFKRAMMIVIISIIVLLKGMARLDYGNINFVLPIIAILALAISLLSASVFSARLVLYPDRIERRTCFGVKSMRREDVTGLRLYGLLKLPTLTSRYGGLPFPLLHGVKTDATWDAWMAVATNLDFQEKQHILTDLTVYPKLGKTEVERRRNWFLTQTIANVCGVVSFVGLVAIVAQLIAPAVAAILLAVPWIAVVNMKIFGGFLTLKLARSPMIGNLISIAGSGIGLLVFGIIFRLRNSIYFNPNFSVGDAIKYSMFFGLPIFFFTAYALWIAPKKHRIEVRFFLVMLVMPILLMTSAGYGVGALTEIDIFFDWSAPKTFVANVLEQPRLDAKGNLRFKISGWGPYKSSVIDATSSAFPGLAMDSAVRVEYHPGRIGIPWFQLKPGSRNEIADRML